MMAQEDKELLLVDLCARLPYMPKIKITYQQQGIKGTDEGRVSCDFIEKIVNDLRNGVITDMQIYLRPLSSMTEKEWRECVNLGIGDEFEDSYGEHRHLLPSYRLYDWLNQQHFDYRCLIQKGLAISTEEFNPYKD